MDLNLKTKLDAFAALLGRQQLERFTREYPTLAMARDAAQWAVQAAQSLCGCALEDAPEGTLAERLIWVRDNCNGRGTDGEIDIAQLDKLIAAAQAAER